MTNRFKNKVVLITGGSSGIGLATAERFVDEGAFVYITGRRQNELDAAVKKIKKNISGIQGDVSLLEDLDRIYATIKKEKGRVDVLFANAGSWENVKLGSITEEHFDKMFNTNVKGVVFTVQKALPMIPNGGSIILTASVVASKGFEGFSIYSATKAAVRSFARTWAMDLKERNIRVNALSPGVIPTPGFLEEGKKSKTEAKQFIESVIPEIPLGRPGTPDEIAKAVLFLASDDSSYITGIELFVDGGIAQV